MVDAGSGMWYRSDGSERALESRPLAEMGQPAGSGRLSAHSPAVGDATPNAGRLRTAGTTVAEEVSSLETTRIGLEW